MEMENGASPLTAPLCGRCDHTYVHTSPLPHRKQKWFTLKSQRDKTSGFQSSLKNSIISEWTFQVLFFLQSLYLYSAMNIFHAVSPNE